MIQYYHMDYDKQQQHFVDQLNHVYQQQMVDYHLLVNMLSVVYLHQLHSIQHHIHHQQHDVQKILVSKKKERKIDKLEQNH